MSLADLETLVRVVRESVQKHGGLLRKSEATTRYVLIDPVLRALGWDTENPDLVIPEYPVSGGAADYALLDKGQPLVFMEAKALGQSLAQGVEQGINRCLHMGTKYFIVTDGARYEIYDAHKPVPLAQKQEAAFDIIAGEVRPAVLNLLRLWYTGTAPGQPLAPTALASISTSAQAELVPQIATPQTASAARVGAPGWVTLSSVDVKPNQRLPERIQLPDGTVEHLNYWNSVLLSVVKWLVADGFLTQQHCPVGVPGGTRNFVHSSPVHPNGSSFFAPRQVGTLWVEVNSGAPQLVKETVFLLQQLGLSPDSVKLSSSL